MPPNYSYRIDTVVVIESLREEDELTGSSLYRDIIVPLSGIHNLKHELYSPASSSNFLEVLGHLGASAVKHGNSPILHIEMHGTQDGLETAGDRKLTSWAQIKPALLEINRASKLNLTITLAACNGESMHRCMQITERAPFRLMIGTPGRPWSGTIERGFRAFYAELLTTLDTRQAYLALRRAGQDDADPVDFIAIPAEIFFRKIYAIYKKEQSTPAAALIRGAKAAERLFQSGEIRSDEFGLAISSHSGPIMPYELSYKLLGRQFFMLDLYPKNAHRFNLEELAALGDLSN